MKEIRINRQKYYNEKAITYLKFSQYMFINTLILLKMTLHI